MHLEKKMKKSRHQRAMDAINACYGFWGLRVDEPISQNDWRYNYILGWLKEECGEEHGVTEEVFRVAYKTYQDNVAMLASLKNDANEQQVSVMPVNIKEQKDVTVDDLLAVAAFCNGNGGMSHVRKALEVLETLHAFCPAPTKFR